MDNIVSLYRSFDGRISRKTFWLWSIALGVVAFVISYIVQALLGINVAVDPTSPDAAAAVLASLQKQAWVSLVFVIIFGWPSLALMTKRRQDRDNNGMDVKVFFGLELITLLAQGMGLGTTAVGRGLYFVMGVYAIYLFIVLGCLRGTPGPNRYGPDPLRSPLAATA